jgi:hypothetical protein
MDCPICFESSSATGHVAGSCGHGVCVKCAGQLFLEDAGGRLRSTTAVAEFIPTLGKCPLCRQFLLYGDLKYVDTLADAFPGDPPDDMLLDAVYVGNPMGIGWTSIHLFEPAEARRPLLNGAIQPWSSSSSYILKGDSFLALTDPKFYRGTNTISFRIRCASTRALAAAAIAAAATAAAAHVAATTAATTTTTEGRAVLSFSDNYSFISRGILLLPFTTSRLDGIWKRCNNGTQLLMFNLSCVVHNSDVRCRLGSFRVDDGGNVVFLEVRHQAIVSHPEFGDYSSEDHRVPIRDDVWTAHVETAPPPDQQPLPLGTRLCWRRIGSALVHDEWILVDANRDMILSRTRLGQQQQQQQHSDSDNNTTRRMPISGRDGQLYWRLDAPGPAFPVYNAHALAGNVFCQNGRIGLASYHFETTAAETYVEQHGSSASCLPNIIVTAAYISYEHSIAATKWPPLDNGRPIPARMYFTNIMITDGGTVFRGTIDWMGTHHTTWNNASCWTYEIRFDAKFQCVVGGAVRFSEHNNSGHDDDDDNAAVFGRSVVPQQQQQQEQQNAVLSEFGTDLVYINAAVYSGADDDTPATETTRRPQPFSVDHIQSCGASAQTILALQRALQHPAQPHSFLS